MRHSRSSSRVSISEPLPAGAPVIRVRGLKTRVGGRTLHENLDLEVYQGEVLGVVGGSGAGKSMLLRNIVGLDRPVAGEIEVFGEPVHSLNEERLRALESRWGVLFQDGALFSSLTVAQNIAVPLKEHLALEGPLVDEIAAVKVALVGLPADAAAKFPAELSGGMRKRAGLARALALDPRLLFLDEPTAGLDPIAAGDFDALIRDLRQALGLTVFMVTHDLDSLVAICDRIAVLVDKRLRIGTMAELLRDPHPWIQAYFHGPRGRAALAGRVPGQGDG
ncbi:MAG TPA: ABC transporter ATP-binding protein [Stellaceae bacterium]|jgi:phospholipid/cholesterol/gamma-HCH transport system ATP-binding protein|nr:ABC transporter ATP-binding protein [Stellaceae bacterium]